MQFFLYVRERLCLCKRLHNLIMQLHINALLAMSLQRKKHWESHSFQKFIPPHQPSWALHSMRIDPTNFREFLVFGGQVTNYQWDPHARSIKSRKFRPNSNYGGDFGFSLRRRWSRRVVPREFVWGGVESGTLCNVYRISGKS